MLSHVRISQYLTQRLNSGKSSPKEAEADGTKGRTARTAINCVKPCIDSFSLFQPNLVLLRDSSLPSAFFYSPSLFLELIHLQIPSLQLQPLGPNLNARDRPFIFLLFSRSSFSSVNPIWEIRRRKIPGWSRFIT